VTTAHAPGAHDADGVLVTVEVRGLPDATAGDLVALADSLREAATQLAPTATTTTTVGFLRSRAAARRSRAGGRSRA